MCTMCFATGDWTAPFHAGSDLSNPQYGNSNGQALAAAGIAQVLSGTANINALIGGQKWDATALTYNFPASLAAFPVGYGTETTLANFTQLTPSLVDATVLQLEQHIAAVSGLTFTRIADTALADVSSQRADLLNNDGSPFTVAYAYFPSTGLNSGDAWYRNTGGVVTTATLGNYSWMTVLHELGHTMGLKHGHEVDMAVGSPALSADRNSMEFSVMTYAGFIGAATNAGYSNEEFGYAQSLMMFDVAALQFMYGANFNQNSTNSTYTFDTATGQMSINGVGQGVPGANRIFRTVWDGNGIDTYDLTNYATNLQIDLTPGGWSLFDAAQLANLGNGNTARANVFNALQFNSDVRSLIENAFGGSGNDSITGNAASNTLNGNVGNDTLMGGAGNDTITGGAGADRIEGGDDSDNINAGEGDDSVFGGDGIDTIFTGDGADYIQGDGGASSILAGEAGNDTIYGGAGNDYMIGGDDNDTLVGLGGINSMFGGTGNDLLISGDGAGSVVDGGAGANQLWGGSGNDYAIGGELADTIVMAGGSDFIFGNAGADGIYAGAGTDYIYGNAGNDFIYSDDIGFADRDYLYIGGGTNVDTVVDFLAGNGANSDVIVVALGNGVNNFAQAQANLLQVGIYTVLTVGADQIYLYNVTTAQVTANNFLFL